MFSKDRKEIAVESYKKGADAKERELIPVHKKEIQELVNEKEYEISAIKSELSSMQRRCDYWEGVYTKVQNDRIQLKIERKELSQIASDISYILNQEVVKNNEILSAIGNVFDKFTKKIDDKK
jgi:hypothetical protein